MNLKMKKNLPILLIIITFYSCSNSINESDFRNPYLERIDSLLTIRNEKFSNEFLRDYATNMQLTATQFNKSQTLHALVNEFEKIISEDSILSKNNIPVSTYLLSLYSVIDELKIEHSFIDTLKMRHIQYWIQKDLKSPLKKETAVAMKIDIKMFEYEIDNYLYNQIRSNDFNFNVLKPIVIESSNSVKSGEIYEAKICFTAFDTTRFPIIKINDTELENKDGYGIYRFKSNQPGKKTIKGIMMFQRNNYEIFKVPFEHSFIVK